MKPQNPKASLQTKVISGIYKNRPLDLPPLDTTRASKNRLKESFFNTFREELQQAVFVEVFSGSGSIGIEALSQGAKEAYFLEQDKIAFQTLQKNIKQLGIKNAHTFLGDSFIQLPKILPFINRPAFFYFDPPFSIRKGMGDIYDKVIDLITAIPKDKIYLIAIEHIHTLDFDERLEAFIKIKDKKFGKTTMSYFKNEN